MTAPCGTPAGYQRHRRRDTDPCDECRKAQRDYMRDLRRRRGDTEAALVPVHVIQAAATQCEPGIRKALLSTLRGVQ